MPRNFRPKYVHRITDTVRTTCLGRGPDGLAHLVSTQMDTLDLSSDLGSLSQHPQNGLWMRYSKKSMGEKKRQGVAF